MVGRFAVSSVHYDSEMRNKREKSVQKLVLVLALILGSVLPGFADAITDRVIANLNAQGFEVVRITRTWLGRMWILAESKDVRREIVFNPATGEILRDYAVLLAVGPGAGSDGTSSATDAFAVGVGSGTQSVESNDEPAAVATQGDTPEAVQKSQSSGVSTGGNAAAQRIMLDPVNPIAAQ